MSQRKGNMQEERERQMRERGESRERSRLSKSEAAETPAGLALMRRAIRPLTEALINGVSDWSTRKVGGRNMGAYAHLAPLDPTLCAYVTVRTTLSFASARKTLRATATAVADRLMSELMAEDFEHENGALYRAVIRNAQARGMGETRQAAAMRKAAREFSVVEERWTTKEKLYIGTKLIELLIESLGIVEVFYRDRGVPVLKFSAEIGEWFSKYNNAACLTRPLLLPMVVPPKPWDSVEGGGYFSNMPRHRKIVTRMFPGHLDALERADMRTVYGALNSLQETPWMINNRLLEAMKKVWQLGSSDFPIPPSCDLETPEAPYEVVNDVRGGPHRKAWRRKMREIHEANAANRSRRFEFQRALDLAEENATQPSIYFPYRLDFRGRAYASTTTLNPQGPDNARALLMFAKGCQLGSEGEYWLGVHGANLYGNDKVTLDERYQWAKDYYSEALDISIDPIANRGWTKADSPWQFLAWCMEWADITDSSFYSHLPVALDGSCNGIQHFSAMLRDPVGGAAVNLIPSDKPQDIYRTVAETTMARLEEMQDTLDIDAKERYFANLWLSFGIDRKITKRAVMVLPYGGTFKSCMDYVRDAVKERGDTARNMFGEDLPKATAFLAKVVWSSIGEVVVGARTAMTWLQQVTRILAKKGISMEWVSPSGFPVVQRYTKPDGERITTHFLGKIVNYKGMDFTTEIDVAKQVSAVSPNFVHSLDAAAMMATIVRARLSSGIASFAMVHDSYGTHAGRVADLGKVLRAVFSDMYTHEDVLASFYDQAVRACVLYGCEDIIATIPQPPGKGSLDIELVKESAYFFA